MSSLELKPTHKPVQNYYAALRRFDYLGVSHEGAVKSAFHGLLDHCARQHDWTVVPEWEIRRPRRQPLRVDGARHSLSASIGEKARVRCRSGSRLTHGFWEAKNIRDDLPREARKKFGLGYPRDNILFQTPRHALDRITNDESQSVRNSKFVILTFPARRKIIAAEIEKAIDALASQSFSRTALN